MQSISPVASCASISTVGGIAGSQAGSLSFLSEADEQQSRISSTELLSLPSKKPVIDLGRLNAIDPWYSSILEKWKLSIPDHFKKEAIKNELTKNGEPTADILFAIKQRQHLLMQDFIFHAFARGEPLEPYRESIIDFVQKDYKSWPCFPESAQKNCLESLKKNLNFFIDRDTRLSKGVRLDKNFFDDAYTVLRSTTGRLYRLDTQGDLIGRGTIGRVRLIHDMANKIFAVKEMVLNREPKFSLNGNLRFIPKHPYFAQIYDHIVTPRGNMQKHYLIMELVRGITLQKYIDDIGDAQYTPDQADFFLKKLAYQMCYALSLLAENNYAHCSIKPLNLMLKENGDLKIVDLDGITEANAPVSMRTGKYLPPEFFIQQLFIQQHSASLIDETKMGKADVFAAGVTLLDTLFAMKPDLKSKKLLNCTLLSGEKIPLSINMLAVGNKEISYMGFGSADFAEAGFKLHNNNISDQFKGDCLEDIIAMLMTRDPKKRPSFADILQLPYFAEWRTA